MKKQGQRERPFGGQGSLCERFGAGALEKPKASFMEIFGPVWTVYYPTPHVFLKECASH
jgi:hypothetical protein